MSFDEILKALPYSAPFLFVDELASVDENGVVGSYTYLAEADFYKGHFKNHPVTPAVILTETMAQIGVVCLGIFLLGTQSAAALSIGMTNSSVDFLKPVYPNEKVKVISEKVYFRFNKLKCKVRMENASGQVLCKGEIAGMILVK
ncbi:3-hydroxyacyl-[acyl-carrier-protein] dehydratase [Pedobacter sp. UYP30]|uniref:3-hydroxyacyl-ACP dehydratase FabZ family protein n=1 Tax=Pedobacter sp. UYP30 TaxID=1756400 RepID=UPI0033949807